MSKPNEQYAYFTVVGEFNPADLTARLGVGPTKSWKKGDLNPLNHLERKFSRWSLYSRLEHSQSFEDHIEDVLEQLRRNAKEFKAISKEFGGQLELIGYFHAEYPGLVLGRPQIASLAEFGIEVDFDFYYMYSDRREDT
jgi:hypothetical protein